MAILDGIEVRIASKTTGKAFHEYDKPNAPPSIDGLSTEKFIQAETGLEFHIEIFVKPSFKFYHASGLQVRVNIDGGKVDRRRYYSKESLREYGLKGEPVILDDVIYKEGTQWYRIKLNFSSLDIGELFQKFRDNGAEAMCRRRTGSRKRGLRQASR